MSDLAEVDFDALAKRSQAAVAPRRIDSSSATAAAGRRQTRYDLVERIQSLIGEYNAGRGNIDDYLRRPLDLSRSLTDKDQSAAREVLTEEGLAIVDLLPKPDRDLTDDELALVKPGAKKLLAHPHDKLIIGWRRKADASDNVLAAIRRSVDENPLADPYPGNIFGAKVQAVYGHVFASYDDYGMSVYEPWTSPVRRITT